MISWSIIISLLLASITVFSLLRIRQSDFTRRFKCFFSAIRIFIGTALVFAVLEPSFHIRYLSRMNSPLPVLVDASASMTHFAADSVITVLRRNIDSISTLNGIAARDTRWYLFGDSLRALKKDSITFSDKKSYFPDFSETPVLSKAQEAIIISDGHWSNSELPFKAMPSKLFWYIPLPLRHRPSSLSFKIPDTISSPENSPTELHVLCKGVTSGTTRLSFTLAGKDTVIKRISSSIPEGMFTHTFIVDLPVEKPGYYLYDCSVVSETDSLQTTGKVLLQVTPEKYLCSFVSSRPSMDERFLRLAIDRNPLFRKNSRTGKSDVYFIFDNAKMTSKSNKGVYVFIGTPPLQSRIIPSDSLSVTLPAATVVNPFAHLPLSQLPPIKIAIPEKSGFVPFHTYLTVTRGKMSFPVLFSGLYRKKHTIFCTISDLWKWDFLPLSHTTGESEIFSFSESLLELIESVLVSTTSDTLIVFSPGTTTSADSINLLCVTPSIEGKDSAQLSVHFSDSLKNVIFDTSLTLESSFVPLRRFRLPPLPEGKYTQLCSLTVHGKTSHFSSTLTIFTDNSEHQISDQNESLLRQFCSPLSPGTDLQTSPFFSKAISQSNIDREASGLFTLQRSWWLLGAFLFLFFIEIAVRKFQHYD